MNAGQFKSRFFIPEVVQTSAMDCGPAALKSIMEGLGVNAHYGRLREACQTDVDGTSIDTLEIIANDLGMQAEQIMLPVDHIFIPSADVLPAMIVVQLPNRATHFVVIWRVLGGWVQVMDPATGRKWKRKRDLIQEIYKHAMPVPAAAWREWAGSEEFLIPLEERLRTLGINTGEFNRLIEEAQRDASWKSLATLDAVSRMITSLLDARGIKRGREAIKLLLTMYQKALQSPEIIPDHYWSVRSLESEDGQILLELSGAVVLRVRAPEKKQPPFGEHGKPPREALAKVLGEPRPQPFKHMLQTLNKDGWLLPSVLVLAMLLAAFAVIFEALLLRGLLDIGRELGLVEQRINAVASLLLFSVALLFLEIPILGGVLTLGRQLEARLRIAIFRKIPLLNDRYFQSRMTSDMAERAHSLQDLKQAPILAEQVLRLSFALLFTTVGIIWLDPNSAALAIPAMLTAIVVPFLSLALLQERDMQIRTHEGALSRFYLDALLGLTALRAHSAQHSVSKEHEGLLVEWMRSSLKLQHALVALEGLQLFIGFGFAAFILLNHFNQGTDKAVILLLTYWALNLPVLGQQLAQVFRQVPKRKNRLLRLLEPLSSPEEINEEKVVKNAGDEQDGDNLGFELTNFQQKQVKKTGMAIQFSDVEVRASGQQILKDINLNIPSGKHLAIVGPSGAGKSSLVGMLLGWHRAYSGAIKIDARPWDADVLAKVRRETVWLDPTVQLWNQSLLNNITYGLKNKKNLNIAQVLQEANLQEVLQRLPAGMQTELGECGRLVSGGEGQRVRLARALLSPNARLVILDEAFRGLESKQRMELLHSIRKYWQSATLIHISHDIQAALDFDEVAVVVGGTIVEKGDPNTLQGDKNSTFSALLEADIALHKKLWAGDEWLRMRMQSGKLQEVKP